MRRAVLDSNVYISGLQFGGVAEEILQVAANQAFLVLASDSIRNEVECTLARRFKWSAVKLAELATALWSSVEFIPPASVVHVCRDPKDNHLLETCRTGLAEFLVTGDNDLLVLRRFEQTEIVTLRIFLDKLSEASR